MSGTVSLPTGLLQHMRSGVVLADKYRLEEEIGRGSMGTVYRAVHVTLGQRVAIKLISSEHSQSAEARARFSVEAKAAAKLRSRHVVQVIDDGETPEGNPYIVLEYLEGETLEERLERERDVPLADAVRIVTHVGRALARAHAEGIVHRDLKPANIFLVRSEDEDAGWVAKVLDFGIAKLEQGEKGTTQAGTVLGTPLFMSPEQVRGASSVDHRADLYSLGMCLFHMLTGEYAHYSANYSDILVSVCTRPLPKLREKAPWLPEAVEQWFQRACARPVSKRGRDDRSSPSHRQRLAEVQAPVRPRRSHRARDARRFRAAAGARRLAGRRGPARLRADAGVEPWARSRTGRGDGPHRRGSAPRGSSVGRARKHAARMDAAAAQLRALGRRCRGRPPRARAARPHAEVAAQQRGAGPGATERPWNAERQHQSEQRSSVRRRAVFAGARNAPDT
jgi:tRNA A-37 threonylcarbamoyl transferase component Bud32